MMIKKALLVILFVLVSFSSAAAQEITLYEVSINADNTLLKEEVKLHVTNNHETVLRRLTYPFSSEVEGLKTFDEDGGLESKVEKRGKKNYVTTELREPLGLDENATVLYEFSDPSAVTFFNNTYFLSTSFPLLANVKRFNLILRLPEGTGLSDPNVNVVPIPSEITSDGRAVILKWTAVDPIDFRVFVKYETLLTNLDSNTTTTTFQTTTTTLQTQPILISEGILLFFVFLMFLIFSGLLIMKIRSRTRIQEKINILREDEQLILKIVADEDGIEQREIQRRTDFSKTKVSKILSELENREVIRKESMGKKNKVYLTQKLKE